jgi:hypothetical protein
MDILNILNMMERNCPIKCQVSIAKVDTGTAELIWVYKVNGKERFESFSIQPLATMTEVNIGISNGVRNIHHIVKRDTVVQNGINRSVATG